MRDSGPRSREIGGGSGGRPVSLLHMRGLVRRCAAVGVFACASMAHAQPTEIFPVSKVQRGQTGYGLTTFAGTKPERFTFEVVSVMKNFLPKQDIILVKSDDPKLAVTGFWQGMSGSPLYLDDKLLCAFSYGFRFNKVALGGCTPIEYMKREGEAFRRGKAVAAAGGTYKTVQPMAASLDDWRRLTPTVDAAEAMAALGPARKSWLLSAPLPPPVPPAPSINDQTVTAAVPLSIAGFSAPAFGQLEKLFGDSNIVPQRAGGTTAGKTEGGPTQFVPGAPLAVELIRGDMSAVGICTVSYVEGDKVLSCGHPIFQTGETYAPVATASINAVVPSAQSAFLMGTAINEIGSLVQDRQAAIVADTGLRAPTIPVDIAITSGTDRHVEKGTFHVEIMNNKFLTPSLAGAAVMNAINYYLPDRDNVTARVESQVRIKGAEPINFVDYVYANDGAANVMGAVRGLRVLVPLLLNPYAPLTIERVDLKVDLRFEANYGEIKEVKIPTADLVVGHNQLKVLMSTWDGKDIVEDVPVDVPESLAGNIVQLEVCAGDSAKLDAPPPVDLPSLLHAFRSLLPGTIWTVTLYPADEGIALDGKLVRDLPQSALDKLHPQSHTQRAQLYKPIARTKSPAKRVVNGTSTTLVRVRAR
ncbi:MAG TPA: SpoIVB peptidase S55 domain-containing protein [Kofleriaceae bacterium]|nr:SpoIVB peptidase S55 domain-containing protein [Kofleriaceae bacterium]